MLFHCLKHAERRIYVLKFHTVHFYAPFVGGIVEHSAEFGVNCIARSESFIEFHLANYVSQRGLSEFFYCVGQIVYFVNRLEGVNYLEIQKCIDFGLHIVLGYYILFVEIVNLFAQIYFG